MLNIIYVTYSLPELYSIKWSSCFDLVKVSSKKNEKKKSEIIISIQE